MSQAGCAFTANLQPHLPESSAIAKLCEAFSSGGTDFSKLLGGFESYKTVAFARKPL